MLFVPSKSTEVKTDDPDAEVLAFVGLSFDAQHALDTEVVAQVLGTVLIVAHFSSQFSFELFTAYLNRCDKDPPTLANALLDVAFKLL